ncbi:MAG: hypothetical protein JNM85_05475 [Chthonomonas sp.]|nr:hypothetical protein [Chthonomonas sp.]
MATHDVFPHGPLPPLNPDRTWTFDHGDCLYRNADGHRVVGDCEATHYLEFRSASELWLRDEASGARTAVAVGEGRAEVSRIPHCRWDESQLVPLRALAADDLGSAKAAGLSECRMLSSGGKTHAHRQHLGRLEWVLEVPERCNGLRLARLYDRFHGRQRARVLIDGEEIAWWYEPEEDRIDRWAVSVLDVRCWLSGPVNLTLDPPAGATLWDFAALAVWAACELDSER